MSQLRRTLPVVLLCLAVAPALSAQSRGTDLSGHWEGSVQTPAMEIPFAVDLMTTADGRLGGTVNLPVEHIKGLPLLKVAVEGATVTFYARSDQPLTGTLSVDGNTVTGEYSAEGGTAPFSMTRKGEAHVAAAPSSAAVAKDLEGSWTGVIAANGLEVHVRLSLANRADGTSIGELVNLDQGGLRLPLAIAQNGSRISLTSPVVPLGFAGTLDASAGELSGTLTQGTLAVPLTFRRSTTAPK